MSHLDQRLIRDISLIAEALSRGECRKLIYLCGSLETNCSPEFVKETLKSKVEYHGNSPLFLKALISRLGRYDILRKLYKVGRNEIDQQIQSYEQVLPTFRVLMVNLNEELLASDVENIKFLLSNTLTREKMEKSKSFLDVIIELEKLDSVSPERTEIVEKCLLDMGRLDLVKKVNAYKVSAGISAEPLSQQESCRAAEIRQTLPQEFAAKVSVSLPVCREPSGRSKLEHYNFNTNPRGVCVIIDCVGNDGGMLEQTFKALQFNVVLYQWLSADQILSSLREIVRHRENHRGDAFVCCVISRGTTGQLFGTDSYSSYLSMDMIKRLFTGDSCPMLAGKPKLFFIQRYSVPDLNSNNRMDRWDEELEVDGCYGQPMSGCIPIEADIFWSHCWVDERHLQREEHHSAYLKALTEALHRAQMRRISILDVHTEVNRAIFEHNKRNPGAIYQIDVKHTLRKDLYLE